MITITPSDELTPGVHRFQVKIRVRRLDEAEELNLDVDVEATVVDQLHIEPAELLFGIVSINNEVSDFVTLKSRDDDELEVIAVDASNAHLIVDRIDELTYKVAVRTSDPGQFNERVTFRVRHKSAIEEVMNIELPITYTAVVE